MKPMLAKDADPTKLKFPLVAQPKLDGIRAVVIQGSCPCEAVVVARSLKPIPNAEIQAALGRPELIGLDGELIVGEPTAADAFQRTTSFVRGKDKTDEPWVFYVFDKWDEPGGFWTRTAALSQLAWLLPDRIRIVPSVNIIDETALAVYESELLIQGYEGVMVRSPERPYKFGRSYPKDGTLLKIKRFVDFEAEVVGVYEQMHNGNAAQTNLLGRTERSSAASGKIPTGTLGGLVLRAQNGPWAGVEFRCGTGFDAQQRAYLWEAARKGGDIVARRGLNGRAAKIKAQDLGAKDKPRFPVFLGWREGWDA